MSINMCIIICLAISLLFAYTDYKQFYKISLINKSLATLSIAFLSYLCFINNTGDIKRYFEFIFIGILLGFLGDFFLALKKIYKDKEVIFMIGLVAFLIGHVFYVMAFSLVNDIGIYDFCFAAIYLAIAYIVFKKSELDFKNLKYGVILYASVISFMMGKATSVLLFEESSVFVVVAFVGALMFVLSDSVLSFSMFGKKEDKKLSVCCHLLYFPAQVILALSVLVI